VTYLIDANLPFKLAYFLKEKGFEVVHTDQLPNKERTSDKEIREIALKQNYIIVTKDADFLDSHLLQDSPKKLLLITTGNIVNKKLIPLIGLYFSKIDELFRTYNLIELNESEVKVHE